MAVKFLVAFLCLTMVVSTKSNPLDGSNAENVDAKAKADNWGDEYLDADREDSAPHQEDTNNEEDPQEGTIGGDIPEEDANNGEKQEEDTNDGEEPDEVITGGEKVEGDSSDGEEPDEGSTGEDKDEEDTNDGEDPEDVESGGDILEEDTNGGEEQEENTNDVDKPKEDIHVEDKPKEETTHYQAVVSNFKSPVIVPLAGKNAKIVGIMSTFLNVHPFGASIDYIWSYLLKIDPTLALSEVESILQEYPEVFELKLAGVGAAIERKWMFVAFKTQ